MASNRPLARLAVAGLALVPLVAFDGPAKQRPNDARPAAAPAILEVPASVETAPVRGSGDAADDPAIWVNPADPSKSVVIGTDKRTGLSVYDLSGAELQFVQDGRPNNVDLRAGFPLGGREVVLVTAGDRADDTILIYALDPATRKLADVASRRVKTATAYGSCMYRSAKTGKFYYFLANKSGVLQQWELFDDGKGKVDAKLAREAKVGSVSEGCVADDELGFLYVSEERVGIWKYGAEPDVGAARTAVDRAAPGTRLAPEVEGLALAKTGAGTGFIFVSCQGSDMYAVYRREGDNAFVRDFRVVAGGTVDGTSFTDGVDATASPLGDAFPHGLFVAQDNKNEGGRQNFKFVRLERILDGL